MCWQLHLEMGVQKLITAILHENNSSLWINAKKCHAEIHGALSMGDHTLPYQVVVTVDTGTQSGSVNC
jgi:hypothetical protein